MCIVLQITHKAGEICYQLRNFDTFEKTCTFIRAVPLSGNTDRIQIGLYLTNEELTFVMNNEWTKASLCNAKLPEYYMMQHIHIYSFC